MPDVIITGLPRSGATTIAALIDRLPNAICLNHPPRHDAFAVKRLDMMPFCKWLAGDFIWTRQQIEHQEPIVDFRAADGMPLLDGIYDPRRLKTNTEDMASVTLTHPQLKEDFILGMKHHTLYTCLLPTLAQFTHFKIIAVIRHPVDVILSWKKQGELPILRGKPPGISHFWPDIISITESTTSPLDMLVQLYDAFLQRYHEARERIHIIKYEDVIDDPMIVSRLCKTETLSAAAPLLERRKRILGTEQVEEYRQSLRKFGVFTKLYYPEAIG